jgi:hypothetical protein
MQLPKGFEAAGLGWHQMASKRENEENEVGEMLGKSNGAAKRLDHMPRLLGFCGLLFDPGFLTVY